MKKFLIKALLLVTVVGVATGIVTLAVEPGPHVIKPVVEVTRTEPGPH
jgi:ABC-type proline/glycine betaine transport system permease subunit